MTSLIKPTVFACCLIVLSADVSIAQNRSLTRLSALGRQADAVVLGACESVVSTWDAQHRFIVTRATFRVRRELKGSAPKRVTIHTLGGKVGDVSMVASHAVSLQPREAAVLFLRRSEYGSYYVIWGGEQGKLPVNETASGAVIETDTPMTADDLAAWLAESGKTP